MGYGGICGCIGFAESNAVESNILITNCVSHGPIKYGLTGGIVGSCYITNNCSITNCISHGEMTNYETRYPDPNYNNLYVSGGIIGFLMSAIKDNYDLYINSADIISNNIKPELKPESDDFHKKIK